MARLLTILVLLAPLAVASSAHAAPAVTNTNDSGPGSLRNALDNASNPDIINVPPGTYTLTSAQLLADTDVTLRGVTGAGATTIQSAGAFRILCIIGTSNVEIDGVTIHGGHASPNPGAPCEDGQGGGIHAVNTSTLTVRNSFVQHSTATPVQGGGGGIFSAGSLFVRDSVVRDNSSTATGVGSDSGGGGIRWTGSGTSFEVTDSTVSGNTATVSGATSGGGGIYSANAPLLENVTVSGNRHLAGAPSASGGGGGLFARLGGGQVTHVTFAFNHSDRTGGALGRGSGSTDTTLQNTLFGGNTALADPDCANGSATSAGGNLESAAAPTCGLIAGDLSGVDPQLGGLAVNGATNGTFTHELLSRQSPAVELGVNCSLPQDQRGVSRFVQCDSGAYEFDGQTNAAIPDCSPTGTIPLALDEPPGGDVIGLSYRVNSGAVIESDTGDAGETPTPAAVTLPEGRNTLEYFGRWTNGVEQGHGLSNVLVDKTNPSVSVANDQPINIFVITRRATATVAANDALSGLVQDPTASGVRLDTGRRGAATFSRTAADLCTNQASDDLDYRVLAPGLGVRTVLERVKGKVRVSAGAAGSGARASQKGQSFSALTLPRELPVRSLIDTRGGTARLTTARTRREDQIQAGLFASGVFQVLQSRNLREKGLTELRLKGGNFSRCATTGKAGPGAAALSRRAIRRLRGNARGRFRTRGRHSAATVRGTVWQMIDRCDGTLTKVTRGSVRVRDFRRKKTVIVRAGKSYLAKAP